MEYGVNALVICKHSPTPPTGNGRDNNFHNVQLETVSLLQQMSWRLNINDQRDKVFHNSSIYCECSHL